mgnify:CR=1 FL=1
MIPVREFEGRSVAVFGLGRTGIAAAKALAAGGANVLAWDDNAETRDAAKKAGVNNYIVKPFNAETLRTKIAQRDELKVRGEAIVRRFRDFMEFAVGPLAEIKEEKDAVDVAISNLKAKINALQATGGRDEREMAVSLLNRLRREGASDDHLFRVRSGIRQILRDTVEGMWCQPDGVVEIFTIDKGYHVFRDGYWWDPSELAWIPWAGTFFGGGIHATRKELARRAVWLAEANEAWQRTHEGEDEGREG